MFAVDYGLWHEHVLAWWKHKDDPNILFLRYEDLKKVGIFLISAIFCRSHSIFSLLLQLLLFFIFLFGLFQFLFQLSLLFLSFPPLLIFLISSVSSSCSVLHLIN